MNTLASLRAGDLTGATRLELRGGLTEFPREIFELADTLEVLDLSGNALDGLPDDLPRLHKLRVLFCSNNRFVEMPEVLGRCPALEMVAFKANRVRHVPAAALPPTLRWLILTDNEIEALPPALGGCTRMQKLMLAGNRLQALPQELAACTQLELLRISANRFEALPDCVLALPSLAWLACAGNPWDDASEAAVLRSQATPPIAWEALSLQHRLGEGASGVIHRGEWMDGMGRSRPVAVKLFKGAVTSDGWPHSEMAACMAAGAHPNLVAVLGRIEGHPEGTAGLVLELIEPNYVNLAGPPNLASCTRDVYEGDADWPVEHAWRMASGIASAVGQLHARGIVHGDLYAHNILHDGQGHALLGDFGAASFLPMDDAAQALALQRVEVRAFGILLGELLARCRSVAEDPVERLQRLQALQRRCTEPATTARPLFADIVRALDAA
jgi:hypothetical protein